MCRNAAGGGAVENQHQLISQAACIHLAVLGADVGAGRTIEDQGVVAVSQIPIEGIEGGILAGGRFYDDHGIVAGRIDKRHGSCGVVKGNDGIALADRSLVQHISIGIQDNGILFSIIALNSQKKGTGTVGIIGKGKVGDCGNGSF